VRRETIAHYEYAPRERMTYRCTTCRLDLKWNSTRANSLWRRFNRVPRIDGLVKIAESSGVVAGACAGSARPRSLSQGATTSSEEDTRCRPLTTVGRLAFLQCIDLDRPDFDSHSEGLAAVALGELNR